ncbi:MAG: hypothetical protein AB8G86_06545, partial [Saprospiraceae bacterium]
MNLTLHLKAMLLSFEFLFTGISSVMAQCNFSNQTERLAYAAIKDIYEQNPKDFLSLGMRNFVNGQFCDICDVPEVYCENGKAVGLFLMGKNLTTIPRSIAAFSDLRFLFLDNNQLSCLPKEVGLICSGTAADLTLEGNPIFNTTGFFDFCANPRDICIHSKPFNACDNLGFINYLDTLYILGLGERYNKVEIIGAPTNWKIFPVCEYCDDFQLINDLPNGNYTLKINVTDKNGQSCYREEKITINNNGNQSPITPNDIGAVNCDNLEFEVSQGDIYINGLTAAYNKVEYIGANTNWKVVLKCDGTCSENTLIPSLAAGTYTIKIFQADGLGNNCYREKVITIEDVDITLPTNEFGAINCDSLEFEVNFDGVYINGLTAVYNKVEYIGANTDWKVITECNGELNSPIGSCASTRLVQGLKPGTYTFKIFQRGEFGENCYQEESITISTNDLPYPSQQIGSLNCNNLVFDRYNNQISIDGLTATYNKVEYIGAGTNWKVKILCDDNPDSPIGSCTTQEYSPDLPPGNYTIKVNQKGSDGGYCYQEGTVIVSGSDSRNSNNQIAVDLYPNPARNHIQFNGSVFRGKRGQLLIYNMLGHLVKRVPEMSFE